MATNVTDIATNALEDGVEDYFSAVIYGRMREITAPFLKQYEGDDAFSQAMQSFINTLSMGLAIYSLNKIMTFFFERSAKIMAYLYGYIVAGKIKNAIRNKIQNSSLKGTKAFKFAEMILGSDRTSDRIEMAKMAQEQVNSFDRNKFHYENQHQRISGQIDNYANPMSTFKSNADLKSVTLFTDLTFRGAWLPSMEHKKIYERATGTKVATAGNGSWGTLYKELNKFTSFHKTTNDEIVNLATILTKTLATKGAV